MVEVENVLFVQRFPPDKEAALNRPQEENLDSKQQNILTKLY